MDEKGGGKKGGAGGRFDFLIRVMGSGSEVSPRIHAGTGTCASTSGGSVRNRSNYRHARCNGHDLASASRPTRIIEYSLRLDEPGDSQ